MDPARAANRFGWDSRSDPVRTPAAVVLLPPPSPDVVLLRFADAETAITFADWWGSVGMLNFADYLHRWRVPVVPPPTE